MSPHQAAIKRPWSAHLAIIGRRGTELPMRGASRASGAALKSIPHLAIDRIQQERSCDL